MLVLIIVIEVLTQWRMTACKNKSRSHVNTAKLA
jgi:hypothetical protein